MKQGDSRDFLKEKILLNTVEKMAKMVLIKELIKKFMNVFSASLE